MIGVDELFKMRDFEALNDLMLDSDDWLIQLDAAEALIKLGDERGFQFLVMSLDHEDDDIRGSAEEALNIPEAQRMRENLLAEQKAERERIMEIARKRLQKGKKVFANKVVFLASGALMKNSLSGDDYSISDLTDFGLEGWEVVNVILRSKQLMRATADEYSTGVYFFLQKEIDLDELSEIE